MRIGCRFWRREELSFYQMLLYVSFSKKTRVRLLVFSCILTGNPLIFTMTRYLIGIRHTGVSLLWEKQRAGREIFARQTLPFRAWKKLHSFLIQIGGVNCRFWMLPVGFSSFFVICGSRFAGFFQQQAQSFHTKFTRNHRRYIDTSREMFIIVNRHAVM